MSSTASTCTEGEELLCLEKLRCLKELRCQQRSLHRMECQVQRCYDNYTACAEALKESDFEREKLEMERQRLVQRIHEVDTDRTKLAELSKKLEKEAKVCRLAAPLTDYSQLLVDVNTSRAVLGLNPIPQSQAHTNLTHVVVHTASREMKPLQVTNRKSRFKSGKSYKQCPGCFKSVPRNSISCSDCASPCNVSGRKKLKGAHP